jgi:putative salt-induced outer membrane protein YdiY
MYYRLLAIVTCLMLSIQMASGDELHLMNGDRLTGKVTQLKDGKMLFKSDVAGDTTVDLTNIKTLNTEGPIEVHLKDGTSFNQKVSSAEAGRFAVEGTEAMKAQEFTVADIVSINPPPKPIPKWTGDISAGFTSTHGNTKTETISASLNLMKRTENDRTTINVDYAKGEQEDKDTGETETIEDWWRAKGKYDYFVSKKLYAFVDGRYEKDAVAELDRRMIIGGGAGYQWIESPEMNFSTEGGIASLYEKFDNQTDSNSEISIQLGYHFDKKLAKNISFTNDLTYYPSIDKFSDYFLTTTAGIRADFTERMFMTFKTIFNYDVTPAIGSGSTDVKYFLGFGYRF